MHKTNRKECAIRCENWHHTAGQKRTPESALGWQGPREAGMPKERRGEGKRGGKGELRAGECGKEGGVGCVKGGCKKE